MSLRIDAPAMSALDAIRQRRTHLRFTERPVGRHELESLLEAAVLAPNHHMTEPWRFVVLGPEARALYAGIRARVKAGPAEADADDAAAAKRALVVARTLEVPAYMAVLQRLDADDFRREEDRAACWMAVQNMLLAATALGLGTKISTGRWFDDAGLRALLQALDGERVLCMILVGEPAEARPPKPRTPPAGRTTWLD
jgi:nitroreductase